MVGILAVIWLIAKPMEDFKTFYLVRNRIYLSYIFETMIVLRVKGFPRSEETRGTGSNREDQPNLSGFALCVEER
jgi:hypothetical protein